MTKSNLIERLEQFKTELYDEESELLGSHHGAQLPDNTRKIARLRERQEILKRAIHYIEVVEASLV